MEVGAGEEPDLGGYWIPDEGHVPLSGAPSKVYQETTKASENIISTDWYKHPVDHGALQIKVPAD